MSSKHQALQKIAFAQLYGRKEAQLMQAEKRLARKQPHMPLRKWGCLFKRQLLG
jgi:hypothetical protein